MRILKGSACFANCNVTPERFPLKADPMIGVAPEAVNP